MVLQVLTDVVIDDNSWYGMTIELSTWAYPGDHEELWALEGSSTNDDFLTGKEGVCSAFASGKYAKSYALSSWLALYSFA